MWTNDTELLAQVLEMVSVVASERQIKEPVQIKRPSWLAQLSQSRNPFADAINRMRASGPPRRA